MWMSQGVGAIPRSSTMSSTWGSMDETNGRSHPPTKRYPSAEAGQRSGSRRRADYAAAQSDSEGARQRKVAVKTNNSVTSRKRSRNGLRDMGAETTERGFDDSAWIHRDKLAQIEIQEMEEAGNPRASFTPIYECRARRTDESIAVAHGAVEKQGACRSGAQWSGGLRSSTHFHHPS